MYHQSDVHLERSDPRDTLRGVEYDNYYVCQDCDEIERITGFITDKSELHGWENAECMAIDKFGEDKTLLAIQWLDETTLNNDILTHEN